MDYNKSEEIKLQDGVFCQHRAARKDGRCGMLFKNLFRSHSKDEEPKRREEVPVSPDKPEPVEITAPEEAPPPEDPTGLELSPEHPMVLLWSIFVNHGGSAPEPCLDLAAGLAPRSAEGLEEPAPMTRGDVKRELPRLDGFVSRTAKQRLSELLTPPDEPPPDLDAEARVFLTGQGMTAWVLIFPPSGMGKNVTREMLEKALDDAKVSFGVDEDLLDRLAGDPEPYFRLCLAARGRPPVDGKDGRIEDRFSRVPTKALQEDETGRVDFTALETVQNVQEGDVICRIIFPTVGRDGISVLNQPLRARLGKPAQIPKGRNTDVSADGGSLVALCDGHVEFSGRSFLVKNVLDIASNVDYSTGNISCLGDVHISGDICSGFTVRATGNITVDGVVEASIVEAGGDLIVRKGVQGNGQAILRAHRNIFARYIESSNVYAREDLEAECLINCEVYSDSRVTVRSGRGVIVGGHIYAASLITANIVGSRSEQSTAIFLGGRPCEEFERQTLTQEIEAMKGELEKLERQPDSPAKTQQMSKKRMQISANKMKLLQFDKELEKLGEQRPRGHGRMECGTVYPGTEITIDSCRYRVTHETRQCIATLREGEVVLI